MKTSNISVIITTYNRAHIVSHAIRSVFAQSVAPREIIVVNDGSSDNTLEVLEEFAGQIRVIDQPNGGISAARNAGITAATGEWIAFLDDDDEYAPDRLLNASEAIAMYPEAGVHMSNITAISPDSPDKDVFRERGLKCDGIQKLRNPAVWAVRGCSFVQCLVVKRALLLEIGLFGNTFYEDMDIYVRLAGAASWSIDGRPSLRLIRRPEDAENLSGFWRSRPAERCSALVEIHRKALRLPDLAADDKRVIENGLATYLFELAVISSSDRSSKKSAVLSLFNEASKKYSSLHSRIKAKAAWVGVLLLGGNSISGIIAALQRRKKAFVR